MQWFGYTLERATIRSPPNRKTKRSQLMRHKRGPQRCANTREPRGQVYPRRKSRHASNPLSFTFLFSSSPTLSALQTSHDFSFTGKRIESSFSGIQQQRYMAGPDAVLSSTQTSSLSFCLSPPSFILPHPSLRAMLTTSPSLLFTWIPKSWSLVFLAWKHPYSPGRRHNAFH